jgi:pseudouridine synthase
MASSSLLRVLLKLQMTALHLLQSLGSSRATRLFRWRLVAESAEGLKTAGSGPKAPASLRSLSSALFPRLCRLSTDIRALSTSNSPRGPRRRTQSAREDNTDGDHESSAGPKCAGVRLSKLLTSHLLVSSAASSKARSVTPWSRREAERLILAGYVSVGGRVVTRPQRLLNWSDFATAAASANQDPQPKSALTIKVKGKSLSVTERDFQALLGAASASPSSQSSPSHVPRVWIAHKLSGELVAERDPHDRPSLLERLVRGGVGKAQSNNLKRGRVHLKPIGRLDMSTEGLLLLTNDGRYARDMELPVNQLRRTYRVRVHGPTDLDRVQRAMGRGMTVDGIKYAPMQVRVDPSSRFGATNRWLEVTCCQGKNRQIRKVLSHFGRTYGKNFGARGFLVFHDYCASELTLKQFHFSSLFSYGASERNEAHPSVVRRLQARYHPAGHGH